MSTSLHFPYRLGTLGPVAPAAAATRFWQRLWAAIERHGQRRAAAEMRRVASTHVFSDPEVARQLRVAARQAERA